MTAPTAAVLGRIGLPQPVRARLRGVYLCGACTHPGGSVIGINGRNAAMALLAGAG